KGRLALLLAALPLTALAQGGMAGAFPAKPITFIVPFAAGSATDQIGRAIGQGVTEQTGQAVVIENKPGASAMIGAAT
ncbi:tripartite tricarboxylate transporter substrate binding protein, partial [Salmonella enterica]|nr:tripartite tricarboxylate transporter substrate binding protein [Salmonella enterica]